MITRRSTLLIAGLLAMFAEVLSAAERSQFTIVVGAQAVQVFLSRNTHSGIIESAPTGACLEVLSEVEGWFWVMLAPDGNGTRRSGWVSGRVVRRPSAGTAVPPANSCGVASAPRPVVPSTAAAPSGAGVAGAPTRPAVSVMASAPARTLAELAAANRPEPEAATKAEPNVLDGAVAIGAKSFLPDRRSRANRGVRAAVPPGVNRNLKNVGPLYPQPPRAAIPDDESQSSQSPWFIVQSLRGNLGGGFESVTIGYDATRAEESGGTGLAGINGSFAIVDPRLLNINAGADLQQSSVRRSTMKTGGSFWNYRVELATRTGPDAPLHLFANRATADLDLRPLGPQDVPFGRTRGIRTSRGASWSVSTPRLPKFEFSALSSRQEDDRDPQLGLNSSNSESRTMFRALDDSGRMRYDVNYAHRSADYEVPQAQVGTQTSDDLLNATVHLTPGRTLAIDTSGRASRYRDDVNGTGRSFGGMGGGAAVRWQFRPQFSAAANYDFSTNIIEALVTGSVEATVPGIGGPVTGGLYRTHTLFQHADARVGYVTDRATIEAIARGISHGIPAFQPQTLSDLRTLGGSIRGQHPVHGFDLGAGFDFALGTAGSNRSLSEPYREFGGQASISRTLGQVVRITAEGSLRRNSRLIFYPLLLDSDAFSFRLESQSPQWAKALAAVRWSSGLRDGLDTAIRERHSSYTLGLSGSRYDLTLDVGTDRALSLLQPPDVIGSRIEAAMLIATRPELYLNLFGGADQLGTLTATFRPFKGFSVRARALEQHRRYQGQDEWDLMGGQISGTYQLRELQIELGWERMDSNSLLYNTRDRRYYVRIRRDVSVF